MFIDIYFGDRNQMVLKMIVTEAGRVHCVEDPLDLGYDKMMMVLCLCHSVQVSCQPAAVCRSVIIENFHFR